MTKAEIEEQLKNVTAWAIAPKYLKDAFHFEMKGKQYGQGPTMQAFDFFECGWKACRDRMKEATQI